MTKHHTRFVQDQNITHVFKRNLVQNLTLKVAPLMTKLQYKKFLTTSIILTAHFGSIDIVNIQTQRHGTISILSFKANHSVKHLLQRLHTFHTTWFCTFQLFAVTIIFKTEKFHNNVVLSSTGSLKFLTFHVYEPMNPTGIRESMFTIKLASLPLRPIQW